MGKTELMWAAEVIHYPVPRPKVMRLDDIRVECLLGALPELAAHLVLNVATIGKATLYPPGAWRGRIEFEDPDDPARIL